MTTRPRSLYIALTVTVLVFGLGAANWYERPDRASAWVVAMLVLPVGWGVASLVGRRARRSAGEDTAGRAGSALRTGIIVGGLIIAVSLAESLLVGRLGMLQGIEQRAVMVLVGAYLVFTGNTMPKRLVPLSSLQCDGSRTQAFLRVAGWVWVLSGLTFAISWLALPIAGAKVVTMTVIVAGILIVSSLAFRLHRTRRREA